MQRTTPPVLPNLQTVRPPRSLLAQRRAARGAGHGPNAPDGRRAQHVLLRFYDDRGSAGGSRVRRYCGIHCTQVWPHVGSNKTSTGDLLIGFFQYLLAFPFNSQVRGSRADRWSRQQVISIRTAAPMSKRQKTRDYRDFCMAVEGALALRRSESESARTDPFELSHNLTKGVKEPALANIRERIQATLLRLAEPCPPHEDALDHFLKPAYVGACRTRG